MKQLTDLEIKEIISLYQSGSTPKDIGEKYGIYSESVTRILRNNEVERNQCVKNGPEREKLIISRYNAGQSSEEIAKDLQVHGTTVCRILKRNGIQIREASVNKKMAAEKKVNK